MNATPKQIAFLKTLLDERELDFDPATAMPDTLTKATASYWITECLRLPKKARACPKCGAPMRGRFCDACKGLGVPVNSGAQDVEDGFYRLADGGVAVVKWNRAKTRKYAMRMVEPGEEGHGMHWDYEAGLIVKCTEAKGARRLTLEEAAEYGKLYGCCMVCGRTLTDPKSIEAGIGPICAGRF